jgi:hypothetical protein
MKKALLILFLLMAFNLSSPGGQIYQQKLRHIIEFTQEDHNKKVNDDEILRSKVILYARLQLVLIAMERIDMEERFYNTS